MSNTYSWVISALDCYPQHENQTNVVFTVHWRRQATDGVHTAEIYNSQTITFTPDEPFTPYADLTEEQVITWLETSLGAEQLAAQETALDQQIENQINPPIARPKLPWAAE